VSAAAVGLFPTVWTMLRTPILSSDEENRRGIQQSVALFDCLNFSLVSLCICTSLWSRKRQLFWYIKPQRPYSATQNGLTCRGLALRWRRRRPRLLRFTRRRKHFSKAHCAAATRRLFPEHPGRPICYYTALVGTPSLGRSPKSHARPICTPNELCSGSIESRSIRAGLCVSLYHCASLD
jgi:hypothetical protein